MLAQAIKRRLSKEENQKGFTLIELLAVIVILGIIAVIAIPLIGNVINNAKDDSNLTTASQVYNAARLYMVSEKGGAYNSTTLADLTLDNLQGEGFLDDPVYLPSTKIELSGVTVQFDTDGKLVDVSGVAVTLTPTSGTAVNFSAEEVLKAEKD
ncbi:type II secretion system protein [Paenibacillus sp. FSL R10-2199]|uniref:type II secretion system protein n=1 Tax=Paenibacillus sp. FSL R10-2199 TaxID=2975348 RepID=UPI0030F8A276